MKLYYIRKNSRYSATPYRGPSCGRAGVTPGQYYGSREAAQRDADRLTVFNPVGFTVEKRPKPLTGRSILGNDLEAHYEAGRNDWRPIA